MAVIVVLYFVAIKTVFFESKTNFDSFKSVISYLLFKFNAALFCCSLE